MIINQLTELGGNDTLNSRYEISCSRYDLSTIFWNKMSGEIHAVQTEEAAM